MKTRFNPTQDIRRTILVADDEEINRRILSHNLGRFYDILEADCGSAAIEKIREKREDLSLVMLDLNMPNGTGYDVLRTMQEEEDLKRIPVIVLTSEKEAEVESLQLGAVDFLEKGRDMPEVVIARVKRSIELAEDRMIIRSTEDDELTGLFNRKYFFEYARLMRRAEPGIPRDAIVINVDRFQIINELYGRGFGDQLLQNLAESARRIREMNGGLAARNEADTFFVYGAHTEEHGQITQIIEKNLVELGHTSKIRVRVGIYENADEQLSIENQFDRATVACNSIRNDFTKEIAYYSETFTERQEFEERLIGDFQQAVDEDQIEVYFQPKFRIQGEEPVLASAEALVRWKHPTLGALTPGRFIPVFEKNGLIRRLDYQVWRKTAGHIRAWKEKYGVQFPVSINISRVDLFDDSLEERLIGLIREFGIQPDKFMLEITESAYTDDEDQLVEKLHRLKEFGFIIEMDDFGAGYSSLNSLTELPLDVLKIDMKFARQLTAEPETHRLVQVIMDIADWLGTETVAEGVETKEQMEILRGLGCDMVQGYYFSKPLPAEEFEKDMLVKAVL